LDTEKKTLLKKVKITRIESYEKTRIEDQVIIETNLKLLLNGVHIISFACLPTDLKELGIGYLYTEGIIEDSKNVNQIKFDNSNLILKINTSPLPEGKKFTLQKNSSSGISIQGKRYKKITREFKVDPEIILALMKDFISSSKLFKYTGGVHQAALIKDNSILFRTEDIGRHNAVDKVIGKALLGKIDLSETALFLSGRISTEIVSKSLRAQMPAVISKSAPTSAALDLGKKYGLTMIGFVRNDRMNIYK